jgi:serine phosphatase RsbU (regulator of sigma subunit)
MKPASRIAAPFPPPRKPEPVSAVEQEELRVLVVGELEGFTGSLLQERFVLEARAPERVAEGLGAEVVLLDGDLPLDRLRSALSGLGPPGSAGRPAVLLVAQSAVRVPAELLERVDDLVNGGLGEWELLARVRAALRARQMLLELSRKNTELEELSVRLEAMARRMAEELRIASQVQRSLLATPIPHPRLDVAREYIPVREIGGDYYDLVSLSPDRLAFAIGDVMGKGVPAALLAANLKACLRANLQPGGEPPVALISRVNRLFCEVTPKGLFASLFFGVLDLGRSVLEFVNAGHDPPFLVRSDGTLRDLEDGGTVLGLLEDARYLHGAVAVEEGDSLVLYTDGITDRANREGDLFGVARLKEAAVRNRAMGARVALYSLLGEVQNWSAGVPAEDDVTLIVARLK